MGNMSEKAVAPRNESKDKKDLGREAETFTRYLLGVAAPDSALRRKCLLMAAILETSPVFADEFLPRPRATPGLILGLAAAAVSSGFKLSLGLPLLYYARRFRS